MNIKSEDNLEKFRERYPIHDELWILFFPMVENWLSWHLQENQETAIFCAGIRNLEKR